MRNNQKIAELDKRRRMLAQAAGILGGVVNEIASIAEAATANDGEVIRARDRLAVEQAAQNVTQIGQQLRYTEHMLANGYDAPLPDVQYRSAEEIAKELPPAAPANPAAGGNDASIVAAIAQMQAQQAAMAQVLAAITDKLMSQTTTPVPQVVEWSPSDEA